ncbi:MAG: hypothetical protein GC149_19860 [Gammaproteobacteria bacterium]|nr:hypothetical protein [Gammaproteobacteria bacterium]
MDRKQLLLARLDDIGRSLERSGHAVALIGLGSVGTELDRLDAYSDLDFFAIIEEGFKWQYLDNLDWLASVCPIAYCYRNTMDGHKVLFVDDVFAEFAVFEPPELAHIPFAPGRIVWKRPEAGSALATPQFKTTPPATSSTEWLLGEALSNLYVGLCRWHRGERLSAVHLIQVDAVKRTLELAKRVSAYREQAVARDSFNDERRFEKRYPELAQALPHFIPGYAESPAAARAILSFLERNFAPSEAMVRVIG